jgi:hypothetical protein
VLGTVIASSTTTTIAAVTVGSLPFTGSQLAGMLAIALGAIALGLVLLGAARSRRGRVEAGGTRFDRW